MENHKIIKIDKLKYQRQQDHIKSISLSIINLNLKTKATQFY